MPPSVHEPVGNWLLDAVSSESYERLAPNLQLIQFSLREIVYEPGARMKSVFFPTTSYLSLLYTTAGGETAEMGLVGNEGVVGVSLFMGGGSTPNQAVVQGSGRALRIPATPMQIEFMRGGDFQKLLLRYTQALMTQISQTAVCDRFHSVEHRLCRWLLMNAERLPKDVLQMTHKFISERLGIRREAVSNAAHSLQEKGLISYIRGQLKILDRKGLERYSCECYGVVQMEHKRLLTIPGGRPRVGISPYGRVSA